jgi:hypothetical protein
MIDDVHLENGSKMERRRNLTVDVRIISVHRTTIHDDALFFHNHHQKSYKLKINFSTLKKFKLHNATAAVWLLINGCLFFFVNCYSSFIYKAVCKVILPREMLLLYFD